MLLLLKEYKRKHMQVQDTARSASFGVVDHLMASGTFSSPDAGKPCQQGENDLNWPLSPSSTSQQQREAPDSKPYSAHVSSLLPSELPSSSSIPGADNTQSVTVDPEWSGRKSSSVQVCIK